VAEGASGAAGSAAGEIYQVFGLNYQDHGRLRAHLWSIAKGDPAHPKEDAMLKTTLKATAAAAVVTVITAAAPTHAAQFTVHQLPDVAPSEVSIVNITGEIMQGDSARFEQFMNQLPRTKRQIFFLASPGGNLGEALDMSVIIADNHAHTAVLDNAVCASACFWLFAPGEHRAAGEKARIGVHAEAMLDGKETAESMAADAEMARFGKRVGIPPSVIGKMVSTPSTHIAWLDRNDLAAMNVDIIPTKEVAAAPPPAPAPARAPVLAAPPAAPAVDAATRVFTQGRADRLAYEAWYAALPPGQTKDGATYWADVRSTKQAATGCYGPGYVGKPEQQQWADGCLAAKAWLDPFDYRRTHEPDYKAGWNSASRDLVGPQPWNS
jgi:hypothetical protein